ncbi:glutamate decarboxylase [Candidozyma auris]|nr:glutamate decarboxylase [[Candida] auris]
MAGLALKKRWQEKRKAEGKSTENPNIIMSSIAQVALEKFARYFDVENRTIHVNEGSDHVIDVQKIKENINENTIGIFVILGSTFTGNFEPVQKINNLLDEVEKETGLDIKIHVDGASGGFVAPFVYPHLKWDFAVPRVVSINTSGHKFGLTTAGLGWIIWKHNEFAVQIGLFGWKRSFVVELLESSKYYEVLSVIHKPLAEADSKSLFTLPCELPSDLKNVAQNNQKFRPGLPVVAFRFSEEFRKQYHGVPQAMISVLLRKKGFIVPNYNLSPDEQDKEILRVVVRPSCNLNLLEKLIQGITEATELLIKAYDGVVQVVSAQNTASEEERRAVIHDLLLSIASDGVNDKKKSRPKCWIRKASATTSTRGRTEALAKYAWSQKRGTVDELCMHDKICSTNKS